MSPLTFWDSTPLHFSLSRVSGLSHFLHSSPHCHDTSVSTLPPHKRANLKKTLTGTMPKFKADVCAPEFIHRNRKFQQFGPPGTVVMIEHKGVVLTSWRLSRAEGDKILTKETRRLKTASFKDYLKNSKAIALLCPQAPRTALHVESPPRSLAVLFCTCVC